jgi:hypothetical protein
MLNLVRLHSSTGDVATASAYLYEMLALPGAPSIVTREAVNVAIATGSTTAVRALLEHTPCSEEIRRRAVRHVDALDACYGNGLPSDQRGNIVPIARTSSECWRLEVCAVEAIALDEVNTLQTAVQALVHSAEADPPGVPYLATGDRLLLVACTAQRWDAVRIIASTLIRALRGDEFALLGLRAQAALLFSGATEVDIHELVAMAEFLNSPRDTARILAAVATSDACPLSSRRDARHRLELLNLDPTPSRVFVPYEAASVPFLTTAPTGTRTVRAPDPLEELRDEIALAIRGSAKP